MALDKKRTTSAEITYHYPSSGSKVTNKLHECHNTPWLISIVYLIFTVIPLFIMLMLLHSDETASPSIKKTLGIFTTILLVTVFTAFATYINLDNHNFTNLQFCAPI